jgi:hypothetical protein
MIQRIQSVYLALAVLSMALMFAFKVAAVPTETAEAVLTIYGATIGESNLSIAILVIPPYVFNVLIIILLITSLLMYKNRKRQMMLGRLSYLLILGYFVFLYFAVDGLANAVETAERVIYGAGIYFPVAALAFVFLANRAIKKDEALVRSLDRLR